MVQTCCFFIVRCIFESHVPCESCDLRGQEHHYGVVAIGLHWDDLWRYLEILDDEMHGCILVSVRRHVVIHAVALYKIYDVLRVR